jgi:hypothetical protein
MTLKPWSKAETQLVLALACGASAEAAGRQAKLSTRTVHRRLKDPDFQKEVLRTRTDMVQRTCGALTAAAMESVKTLLSLQQPVQPPAVRLGAARAVLELGMKVREVVELEVHMEELEERVEAAFPAEGGRSRPRSR